MRGATRQFRRCGAIVAGALMVAALMAPTMAEVRDPPPGTSGIVKPLPRSWQGLRLGMTPTEFGGICKKFNLGSLKEAESFEAVADSPVALRCPHGCEGLRIYTCEDDQAYGEFLRGRAILVFGNAMLLHPDPCERLCRGFTGLQISACGNNARCEACSACLNKEVAQELNENEKQTVARIAGLKRLYGPPDSSGGAEQKATRWYAWRDTHTLITLDQIGGVEIDDVDAAAKLTSSAQKLYGLIVMNPLVGFGSFSDASQVGRHVAKGGLSVEDLAALEGAVTLPKDTLVVEADNKVRMPESGDVQERAEGSASEFLVPTSGLLVWIPLSEELAAEQAYAKSGGALLDCTNPDLRKKHRACRPTNPYGKPSM